MSPIRKWLLVGVGAFALHGLQACTSETELNPQPLPPQGGDSTRSPTEEPAGGADKNGTSSGVPAPPPTPARDAGAEGGDAADGGNG